MGHIGRIEQSQGHEVRWHALAELTPAGGGMLRAPMATLQLVGGRKDKIRAGDVLGALTGEAGFQAAQVGKIHVNEFSTYVAVERAIAQQVEARLASVKIKGKRVKARLLPA
jgi:ATP-independent RNA helicase DbpA